MDPITHGITGALLGKAFFTDRETTEQGRVALFAATLGSVFPDVDVIAEIYHHDPLSIARVHRGFTHSFVGLPLFAAAFAWVTSGWLRRRGRECPPWTVLTAAYAVGIASHILLDAMTTFGTRIWSPLSQARVSWDLLFIIDFTFTAIVLLPQVAAWVYRNREASAARARNMWALFSTLALAVWELARAMGYPFSLWGVAVASVAVAGLFFLPARRAWGFTVRRSNWCRAGVVAMAAYIAACGVAHHAALRRVSAFAVEKNVAVERLGALPLPASLLNWSGLVRATDGVYQSRFSLRDPSPPEFQFFADSAPNRFTAAARALPDVRTYLWFARFPTIRYSQQGDRNIVAFGDRRFFGSRNRGANPFTFRVIFDSDGRLIGESWVLNGGLLRSRAQEPNTPPSDAR